MTEKKKVSKAGIIFTLIISILTIITLFQFADFKNTLSVIGKSFNADLLVALLIVLAYILIYPLGLVVLSKGKKTGTKFAEDYLIGASEHFFNGITPYQTGAQPFQIYSYTRCNLKASEATGPVLVNFLSLLIASNIFVLISLIFGKDLFTPFVNNGTLWIPIIGITMNFLTLLLFIFVATAPFIRKLLKGGIRLLCKIKFLSKWLSKSLKAFDDYCDNAQTACKEAFFNLKSFIPAVVIKLICLTLFYSVPYFILRALSLSDGLTFTNSLFATAFTVNSVVWIPTPGTSGGIEFAFTSVFRLKSEGAVAAAILWRGFTYYLLMIISAIEYVIFSIVKNRKNKKNTVKNDFINTQEKEKKHYDLTNVIEVVMAGDKNVLDGISMCAFSAVRKTPVPIRLYLMTAFSLNTSGITENDAKTLEEKLKKVNPLTEVIYLNLTEKYNKTFLNSPNKKPAYSVCSLLRLFALDYVKEKRFIYLDADTMCYNSLTEFFTYDISDKEFAVVLDYMGKFWISRDYFNSGVLFVNTEMTKKTRMFDETINLLMKKRYYMADQTGMYKVSKFRLYLPVRFNEQRSIKSDTVIKHFNKGIKWFPFFHLYNVKQWQRDKVHKKLKIYELDNIFAEYDKLFKK